MAESTPNSFQYSRSGIKDGLRKRKRRKSDDSTQRGDPPGVLFEQAVKECLKKQEKVERLLDSLEEPLPVDCDIFRDLDATRDIIKSLNQHLREKKTEEKSKMMSPWITPAEVGKTINNLLKKTEQVATLSKNTNALQKCAEAKLAPCRSQSPVIPYENSSPVIHNVTSGNLPYKNENVSKVQEATDNEDPLAGYDVTKPSSSGFMSTSTREQNVPAILTLIQSHVEPIVPHKATTVTSQPLLTPIQDTTSGSLPSESKSTVPTIEKEHPRDVTVISSSRRSTEIPALTANPAGSMIPNAALPKETAATLSLTSTSTSIIKQRIPAKNYAEPSQPIASVKTTTTLTAGPAFQVLHSHVPGPPLPAEVKPPSLTSTAPTLRSDITVRSVTQASQSLSSGPYEMTKANLVASAHAVSTRQGEACRAQPRAEIPYPAGRVDKAATLSRNERIGDQRSIYPGTSTVSVFFHECKIVPPRDCEYLPADSVDIEKSLNDWF